MIYEKNDLLEFVLLGMQTVRLQNHFFNTETLGGRLYIVLLEWKTLWLN